MEKVEVKAICERCMVEAQCTVNVLQYLPDLEPAILLLEIPPTDGTKEGGLLIHLKLHSFAKSVENPSLNTNHAVQTGKEGAHESS